MSLIPQNDIDHFVKAAAEGDLRTMQNLHATFGQDLLNARSTLGHNALGLYIAFQENTPETLHFLLTKGASIDKAVLREMPILIWAARYMRDTARIQHILDLGVNTELRDDDGCTALHHACGDKRADLTQILLAAGAMIDAPTHSDQTPLMLAVCSFNRTIVEMLLQAGANTQLKDKNGLTARDMAIAKQDAGFVRQIDEWALRHQQMEIERFYYPVFKDERKLKTAISTPPLKLRPPARGVSKP